MKRFILSVVGALLVLLGLTIIPAGAVERTAPYGAQYVFCRVSIPKGIFTENTAATATTKCAVAAGITALVVKVTFGPFQQPYNAAACDTTTMNGSFQLVASGQRVCGQMSTGVSNRSDSFYSGGAVMCSFTRNGSITVTDSTTQCGFVTEVSSTSYAVTASQYPDDWFTGGTPNLPAPPAPVLTCSRTLSAPSDLLAYFTASATPTTGVTYTYSWAFGDSTTSTNRTPTHKYSGTMPDSGWTATVTATATGDGTTYSPTTTTSTCSLRVDFYNPTATTPSTTGQGIADDSQCPSGWGWINPAAIVVVLKCLFIPTSSSINSLDDMGTLASTKAPFSWVAEVVTYIPNALDAMATNAEASGGCGNIIPHIAGTTATTSFDTCHAGDDGAWRSTARAIISGLFLFALAVGIYRLVMWTIA